MKITSFLPLFVCFLGLDGWAGKTNAQPQPDEDVKISPKCAAVLIAMGTSVGAVVTYAAAPAALCTAGFCSAGVTGGSFAAWWQSTFPLVAKGSLFAKLQALAMGGSGIKSVAIAGGALGGTVAAQYVDGFCKYVDSVDPETPVGRAVEIAPMTGKNLVKTGKMMGEAKSRVEAECAASKSCTAVVEMGSDAMEYASAQTTKAKDFVSDACTSSETCSGAFKAGSENMK